MSERAKGTFEVEFSPHPPYDTAPGATLGQISIAKQFHGDLEATSHVEMLSARTEIPNSAGYVAIERVQGSLLGREGSFVLQHNGLMNRGAESLSVIVVPDSGTGALKGLSGKMSIQRDAGEHAYLFEFDLDRS
ncbi:MAG TPA: DUF3224 domain-containing protein [Polyangiales bacterium]|jgi:hypothetical protein|nr:DUF3224 domain-containing protein [Polyangiales bacterium]